MTKVGSNHVEVTGLHKSSWRVHEARLHMLRREPDHDAVIAREAARCQAEVGQLRGEILNVSAYQKGDDKPFLVDLRTREKYATWATLLLPAEAFVEGWLQPRHEGPPPAPPKRVSTRAGRERYRKLKRAKDMVGKVVETNQTIVTGGGARYPAGGRKWRVTGREGSKCSIRAIGPEGGLRSSGMKTSLVAPAPFAGRLAEVREVMEADILATSPDLENPCDIGEREHLDWQMAPLHNPLERELDLLDTYLEEIAC